MVFSLGIAIGKSSRGLLPTIQEFRRGMVKGQVM